VQIERGRVTAVGLYKAQNLGTLFVLLAKLPALRILDLSGTTTTDADLSHIGAVKISSSSD
jgi:hypothetical protein